MYNKKYLKYEKKYNFEIINGGKKTNQDTSDSNYLKSDEIQLIKKINLGLNKKEKKIINNIKITNENAYAVHFYFSDKDEIIKIISDFFIEVGDNSSQIEKISKIIFKIIKNAIDNENQESGIINIRVSFDNDNIDDFRWHRDGRHIKISEKRPVYKFVTTLRGESTPYVIDKDSIEKYNQVYEQQRELDNCIETYFRKYDIKPTLSFYKELWKITAPPLINAIGQNYLQAKTLDEGIFFLTMKDGSDDLTGGEGVIHSEPRIQRNRIFIAVLPGPIDKCKEYVSRRSNKNPQFNK